MGGPGHLSTYATGIRPTLDTSPRGAGKTWEETRPRGPVGPVDIPSRSRSFPLDRPRASPPPGCRRATRSPSEPRPMQSRPRHADDGPEGSIMILAPRFAFGQRNPYYGSGGPDCFDAIKPR